MIKTIIKGIVFVITFVVSLVVISRFMNKDHDNMTMEMAEARLPVISMEQGEFSYNRLYGYRQQMDVAFQRETMTVLGDGREVEFVIDTYGQSIDGIMAEVRSADGERLIEDTPVRDFQVLGGRITAKVALKDLLEKDTEYALTIKLKLSDEEEVRYYTRILWGMDYHETEKYEFVKDFHEKLYRREEARELTKYLETNSRLESNSSFHKVNIHSSFKQITWGDLEITEVTEPIYYLRDISPQIGSFLLKYKVSTQGETSTAYYAVEEYYRVRYTSDRMYLLDYERTMTQIPEIQDMYANNKILLGITDDNVPMLESADGNIVVFEATDRLCSYNISTNKLAVIFSFYNSPRDEERCLLRQHGTKILDVDEAGNVSFAIYGYMNRGRHEGEVGVQVYYFDSTLNTIEELVYIPYDKPYAVLKLQMEQLLYLNRERRLYLTLDSTVYSIDLTDKNYEVLANITGDDNIRVSPEYGILVWQEGDSSKCRQLNIRDLSTDHQATVKAQGTDVIRPLEFINDNIIYGVARAEDIRVEKSGRLLFPMHKISICNSNGIVLKDYSQDNIYVTGCEVVGNQITLKRMIKGEDGNFRDTTDDHITNNEKAEEGKNQVVTADIDIYERYVQIQVRGTIDPKTIQILTPKEVVFEGGRNMEPEGGELQKNFYVYGPQGVSGIYHSSANAIRTAYDMAGVVTDDAGDIVWAKTSRVAKNQIMAIKEPEKVGAGESLAVCLDTMLKQEGYSRDSAGLLQSGKSAMEILEETMDNREILDLTGCNVDTVLYYVNQDIPVLALLKNGEAVLLTGFNEFNVVIFEPSTGRLYKHGMNDTAIWMEENGNTFIAYNRK